MRKGMVTYISATLMIAAVLAAAYVARAQFHRERALEAGYGIVSASVTAVQDLKRRNDCFRVVWVEFRVPESNRTYTYHDESDLLHKTSSIAVADCGSAQWRIGDTVDLAYARSDPALNRPYYGKLSRGIAPVEWKISAAISAALFLVLCIVGIWSARRFPSRAS